MKAGKTFKEVIRAFFVEEITGLSKETAFLTSEVTQLKTEVRQIYTINNKTREEMSRIVGKYESFKEYIETRIELCKANNCL